MKKIAKLVKLWPIFLLTFVYSLSYFSTDYMMIPALVKYRLSKSIILLMVCSFSFLDMLGGYIGWSNFRRLMESGFRDDINFLNKIRGEQKTKDFVEWLKILFARKYLVLLSDNKSKYDIPAPKRWLFSHLDGILKWAIITLKSGGYLTMFLFGLSPIPGSRMVPDVLCGTMRWKKGFAVLAVSNLLRITAFVYGWGRLLS